MTFSVPGIDSNLSLSCVGKIPKQRRVMIPLTVRELARVSGVSPTYVGRIEKGER